MLSKTSKLAKRMIYTKIGRRGNVAPFPSKTPYWNKNQNYFMSQFEPIVQLPTYSPNKGLHT
jgi:hypothetical protein